MKKLALRFKHYALLLKQGWPILRAAARLGIARRTAYNWAHRAVEDGLIDPSCAWPLEYRPARKNGTQVKPVGDLPELPLMLPHKYGGIFLMTGRPQHLEYDNRGRAFLKEGSHTAQIGRNKAVIWVKHFRGPDAEKVLQNAYDDLLRLAGYYSQKFGVTMTLERVFTGTEWVVVGQDLSDRIGDKLGIEDGSQKELAGIIVKKDDSSHPGKIEFNAAVGYPQNLPEQHARTFEFLMLRSLPILEKLIKLAEKEDERITALEKEAGK